MEDLIKFLESKVDPNFDRDADWYDWGNVDDAHSHGVEEGFQDAIEMIIYKIKNQEKEV